MSCESGGSSGKLPKDVTTTATVGTGGESRENHTIADDRDSDIDFRYDYGHAGNESYPSHDAERQHQGFQLTQNAVQTEQASGKRTTHKPQQVFIGSGVRLAAQQNGEEEALYLMDRRWNKESRTGENTMYTGPQELRTANAQVQDQAGYEMQKSTSHQPGRRVSFASSAAIGRSARDKEFPARVPKFTQFSKLPPEGMLGTEYAKSSETAQPQEFNPQTGQAFNYPLESPPVSLKVKMHNDGRHVTLRRLTKEEEAVAQREARQRENRVSSGQRRRDSSISSSSGGEYFGSGGVDKRWRRNKAPESAQANTAANAIGPPVINPAAGPSTVYPPPSPYNPAGPQLAPNQGFDPQTWQAFNLPPRPPTPGTLSAFHGPVTSVGTDSSGATEYVNNRRRRRAERAHARLARDIRRERENTVEFT